MHSKNLELLDDFVAYCNGHQEQRFWQALRNWSGASYIKYEISTGGSNPQHDTFYWNERSPNNSTTIMEEDEKKDEEVDTDTHVDAEDDEEDKDDEV